jgi:hypothetical protein
MENFDPLTWLSRNKDIISVHKIEKILNIPQSMLSRGITGERNLPEKYVERLRPFLIDRFNIKSN